MSKMMTNRIAGFIFIVAMGATIWSGRNEASARSPSQVPQVAGKGWPAGSSLALAPKNSTFVLFVEPYSAETEGRLTELAKAMQQTKGGVLAYVMFIRPDGKEDDWEVTAAWHRAAAIPGVVVLPDPGGREATRFALPPGQLALFRDDGAPEQPMPEQVAQR